MKQIKNILSLVIVSLILSGFYLGNSDVQEQRLERKKVSKEILKDLYKYAPDAKQMVKDSYAYATFSSIGVNLILFSAEGAKGLVYNNKNGKITYMNMASGGVGLGLGLKDFRIVFLFKNKKVYKNFIDNGWEANAQADVAAKMGKAGGAINTAITVAPGIRIYKLTKNGLAIQATIQGSKYWKDNDLN